MSSVAALTPLPHPHTSGVRVGHSYLILSVFKSSAVMLNHGYVLSLDVALVHTAV